MSELWMLNLVLFYFIFFFILFWVYFSLFFILDLDKEVLCDVMYGIYHKVVTYVTIISHPIMWHKEEHKRFWNK